jgi:predicted SAM-dependent methyltransferase
MPWLTDSVYWEDERGDPVTTGAAPVRPEETQAPKRLVHVVNPYRAPSSGDVDDVQSLTFETMRRARDAATLASVHLLAATTPDDRDCVPEGFEATAPLTRTVADIRNFPSPAPLPLLFDILRMGCERAEAIAEEACDDPSDVWMIFTNTDICLLPDFYDRVFTLLSRGFDALTINRRTVADGPATPARLDALYADYGTDHPGYDCFVFPLSALERFIPSAACVGRDFVMRGLLYNLIAEARCLGMVRKSHLTFHIGDDASWRAPEQMSHGTFNVVQARRVLRALMGRDEQAAARLATFCAAAKERLRPAPQAPRALFSDDLPTPFRLHIGGREQRDGWAVADVQPGPGVDYTAAIEDLSLFPDGSCDAIYASHVLEHVSHRAGLPVALAELRRLLKRRGTLYLAVPDMEALSRVVVQCEGDLATQYHAMAALFGGQTGPFDYHKSGFTRSILSYLLQDAGFTTARKVDDFGLFDDASRHKIGGVPVSLNVIARA